MTTIEDLYYGNIVPHEYSFKHGRCRCSRKPGTGCVTMINDHLYEGRYTPTNAYGKRKSRNKFNF